MNVRDVGLLVVSALTIISSRFAIIEGQTITPVYVQSNAPVTLTCPADDQATTMTWTGPGDILYVTGTTVEAGLSNSSLNLRISARHTGGSYTLTFTEFRSSDTGIYTCTVDGTVDLQMVRVQGVTSASPVYTRQGGTVTLQCPDTGGTTSWSVTSITLLYTLRTDINPAIPDDTRTRLSVTRQDGTYNLQISDVHLSDVREYQCRIGVTDTFYHLLLYIPPAFPEIENTVSVAGQNRTTGMEDGSMTLTCNSRGGTPAASVSWIKDGTTLDLMTSDNTVQYTNVFTRADDITVYTCRSSSPALTSPQTTSVLIYLDLKPGQPTISDQLSPTENTNLQVVCVSTGSRPAAIIQWNVGGTWQSNNPTEVRVKDSATDTYTVTSTLSLPVTRQDNGISVFCRASNQALSGGIESVRRSITVLYPPDILVNYANTTYTSTSNRVLTCVPDGKPDTYKFGQWRHTAEDGTEIRQLTGSSSQKQSVLILPDPGITRRYEDTGYYICTAANGIPDSYFYSSGSVSFVVEAPPVIITNTTVVKGKIGSNVSIEVEFYSRPAVNPNGVIWTRGSERVLPPDSFASLDVRTVLMSFHGVGVHVKGYVAILKITALVEGDFGDYTVTMENSQGKGNYTFVFEYANPPLHPESVEILAYDSNSITIQWTPSTNGGAEQYFVIGYKSDISEDFVDLAPIPDTHESTQSYQITGLNSGTTHFIRMYAENQLGQSDSVFFNQTTDAAGEEGQNIGPLVGGIAGSALGLIAIAVVAIVLYKRRATAKDGDMEMINSHSRRSEEINSDGLKANVLYESAGANFQQQPGPSSEYAIVCKPNKKNGAAVDPNSVYAVVDKSNKDKQDSNDVYAVVDKQPPKKGGKGGKKNKKEAGPVNGGYEYENIIQDRAASSSSAKVDHIPSRKQNQDGLLYLDVEFKDNNNSERRAVIHGIENRTDYADVDFTQRTDPVPSPDEYDGKSEETIN